MSAHLGEDYAPLKRMAGPCQYRAEATDHAAELAEALEYLFDYIGPMGPWEVRRVAHDALKSYKQSRGE